MLVPIFGGFCMAALATSLVSAGSDGKAGIVAPASGLMCLAVRMSCTTNAARSTQQSIFRICSNRSRMGRLRIFPAIKIENHHRQAYLDVAGPVVRRDLDRID